MIACGCWIIWGRDFMLRLQMTPDSLSKRPSRTGISGSEGLCLKIWWNMLWRTSNLLRGGHDPLNAKIEIELHQAVEDQSFILQGQSNSPSDRHFFYNLAAYVGLCPMLSFFIFLSNLRCFYTSLLEGCEAHATAPAASAATARWIPWRAGQMHWPIWPITQLEVTKWVGP